MIVELAAAGAAAALGAQRGHRPRPAGRPPVAVVANQPRHLGGVLDAVGSEKAARFVNFCDSFGVPLIAVVDTPGFMPGSKQEQAGVIRHGASLVRAFAAARVPKLTVILRKSYGGAYITMDSRDLGADLVLAWPDAELGIMSARAAVESSTVVICWPRPIPTRSATAWPPPTPTSTSARRPRPPLATSMRSSSLSRRESGLPGR